MYNYIFKSLSYNLKMLYSQFILCIPWLQQQYGITSWEIFGLRFGGIATRGTTSGFLKSFFRS